ncbi:MAG TPA: histidine phosphatase family protein [Bryobacteraceae bacterium]|nr:histidine phosphatase family protein [Bryobacteraceae bacterium]
MLNQLPTTPGAIYLLRHGSTSFDEGKRPRAQGWIKAGLDERGKSEARMAKPAVAKLNISRFLAGSLPRTRETVEIVADGEPVTLSRNLRCQNIGVLVGKSEDVVNEILGDMVKTAPDEDIPNGESYVSYRDRFLRELESALHRVEKSGENELWGTHSKNIQLAMAAKSRDSVDAKAVADPPEIKPCAIIEISVGKDGKWQAREINWRKSAS